MSETKARLVSFPPLTHPPRWAVAPPPRPALLRALQQTVVEEQQHLVLLQDVLNIRPSPGMVCLRRLSQRPVLREHVLAELRAMEYPADLTGWIDTARTLARQASDALDDCFQAIDYMRWATPGSSACARQLEQARRSCGYALRSSQTLYDHLEHLVRNVVDLEELLAAQAVVTPTCPTSDGLADRIIFLADVVRHH